MKQSLFETHYQAGWEHFTHIVETLEQGKKPSLELSQEFIQQYRQICQHLALAESRNYSALLIDYLQQLAMRGHRQLYRHQSRLNIHIVRFLLVDFPCLVRKEWRLVSLASSLLFGSLFLLGGLCYFFPDLIYTLLDASEVNEMERMYEPGNTVIGPHNRRAASSNWFMFGFYIMNNIGIAFQTFASGLLLGVGTLFILLFNGMTIGAVAGYLTQLGHGETFWTFVIGHGAFELTAIALAGAAGLKLGQALLLPGRLPRIDALRIAANSAVRLMLGVVVMLVIAAFIEAFWSSITFTNAGVKYAVGALFWSWVIGYLLFAGRTHHAPD